MSDEHDPRELLAWLNPTAIRLDIARGGVPGMTPQDVAAALAFIPAGLGREVFCALWWPDGAKLDTRALTAGIARHVGEEWRKQVQEVTDARVTLGIAHALAGWHGRKAAQDDTRRAQTAYDAAKARCWPETLPDRLPAIIDAVLSELAKPGKCRRCCGRGHVMSGALVSACKACDGRGVTAVSDVRRAKAIGVNESTYRRVWCDVYNWLLRQLSDAEQEARRAFCSAIRH